MNYDGSTSYSKIPILLSVIFPRNRTHGQRDMREPEVLLRAAAKQEFEGCAKLIYCDAACYMAIYETFHVSSRSCV